MWHVLTIAQVRQISGRTKQWRSALIAPRRVRSSFLGVYPFVLAVRRLAMASSKSLSYSVINAAHIDH
jgi:hypothetical protein